MISLHGTWIPSLSNEAGQFILWGEGDFPEIGKKSKKAKGRTPKSKTQIADHPYAIPVDILNEILNDIAEKLTIQLPELRMIEWTIRLPSINQTPLPSRQSLLELEGELTLNDWNVAAICLPAADALELLAAIPVLAYDAYDLPCDLGADLRFWSIAGKFTRHLISEQKFIPAMLKGEQKFLALWQPDLTNPADAETFERLAKAMPDACRNVISISSDLSSPRKQRSKARRELPLEHPKALLQDFLSCSVDAWVRKRFDSDSNQVARLKKGVSDEALIRWFEALTRPEALVEIAGLENSIETLYNSIQSWIQGGKIVAEKFRVCFRMEPPETETETETDDAHWILRYFLQALDDPSLLMPVDVVWKERKSTLRYLNREWESPQERLLAGLGLASRLFSPIERSLHQATPVSCDLSLEEAYQFLSETSLLMQQSGFGVLAPPWWTEKKTRIRPKLRIQSPQAESPAFFSLDRIVRYDLELALGGETITLEELERLAKLKVPLVRMRGEWVLLRPEEVKAALAAFEKYRQGGEMLLRQAIQLSLSESPKLGDLSVETVECSGWMKLLLEGLRNQRMRMLRQPKEFIGTLRPYQRYGFSWLSFMRQWGLGACLADDMGLGKCASADSLIAVNSMLQTAEAIWDAYAGEAEFDGEGFWAAPTEPLLVNALDEEGRIVLAPIRRLYRQRVREKLRMVRLRDGSSVTITRQHRLLTNKGWTNDLQVGDYVCVPAKIVWDGQPEDPDLVKFLAWQIAEGYEQNDRATVTISQKDSKLLEDLLQTFQRVGQKYNLTINHPSIYTSSNRVPHLQVNSQSYRRFLEAKDYRWGKLSREKTIPTFIMQADLDCVRIFLQNYFDAEASVVLSMYSIEISTASALLIQQLSLLLRRFGIWLQISTKQKRATNGSGIFRTYYIGVIGGNSARRFLHEIGFIRPDKQQRLKEICERVNNTNIEGIPASDIVTQLVDETGLPLRHFGVHSTVYIDGSQQFSKTSLQRVLSGFDRILSGEAEQQYQRQKLSKWTAQTLNAYAHLDTQKLKETKQNLQTLLDQEVFYCKIKAIEDINYEGWVYDFEVTGHHNFVANNILCHNTIQTIALLLRDKKQSAKDGPVLLVCPTSVVGNWQREIDRFSPSLKAIIHHGSDRASDEDFKQAAQSADLVITSYGLTHRDIEDFTKVSWKGVILDEAQNIKNPASKTAQSVRKLQSEYRLTLTGTPIENRLSELWSLIEFLNPGYLGSQKDFHERFIIPIERYGDKQTTTELKSLISPFILRRLKTDPKIIQDLPEKLEMKVYCNLTKEQVTLYEAVVRDLMEKVEESEGIQRRGLILSGLMKLKQLCNHPALLLHERESARLAPAKMETRSGKVQRLTEMLEEVLAERDKALVFTQFTEMGEILRHYLIETFHKDVLFLHGGVPQKTRQRMVSLFQESSNGPPIFLISIRAGGTGLNLTRANHVFHFDRWWNPAVEDQATDRAFRIGQLRNVQVHKFITAGTLEEEIDQLIEKKKALSQSVIGTGEDWLTELSIEELHKLVRLRPEQALATEER